MLTTKIGGKAVGTDEIGVSEDGKTLSMTVHVPGRSEPNVLVFERPERRRRLRKRSRSQLLCSRSAKPVDP
jgi:hypothetical protein